MVLPLMIFHQIQLMVCAVLGVDTNARPNSYRRSRKAAPISLKRTLQGLDQLRQPLGFNHSVICISSPSFPAGNSSLRATTADTPPAGRLSDALCICQTHYRIGYFNQLLFFHLSYPAKQHFRFVDDFNAQFLRLRQFNPAASPAITRSVFFDTLPATSRPVRPVEL